MRRSEDLIILIHDGTCVNMNVDKTDQHILQQPCCKLDQGQSSKVLGFWLGSNIILGHRHQLASRAAFRAINLIYGSFRRISLQWITMAKLSKVASSEIGKQQKRSRKAQSIFWELTYLSYPSYLIKLGLYPRRIRGSLITMSYLFTSREAEK